MKKQPNPTAIRLPKGISDDDLRARARAYGRSKNWLMGEGVKFMIDFDPDFINMIQAFAKDLQTSPSLIIERSTCCYLAEIIAEQEAALELTGSMIPKSYPEFTPGVGTLQFFKTEIDNRKRSILLQDPEYQAKLIAEREQAKAEYEAIRKRYNLPKSKTFWESDKGDKKS